MAGKLDVNQFIEELGHARKAEISRLRKAILNSDPGISETIKWNAPNFLWQGEDRVTMRIQPGDRLQLILHRGAKPKNVDGFKFEDAYGMIDWAAADRGVITVTDAKALERDLADIIKLLNSWMKSVS